MTRIWLVGAQVRAASNGELEGFKKDGMKVTGGPEKRTCRTCSDTKWMKVTWQYTWQCHSVTISGTLLFGALWGWGVLRLVFVCFFLVGVVVVEGGSIMCSNVVHDVFMFEESQNSLMLESLNLKRRVTRENGREYSIGRVPAKRHFLMFQKPPIFCILKYRLPKCVSFFWPGKYWGNVEKSYPLFLGRRTMLQKMPSWESKLAMHWCSCCQWYVWCGLGAGIVCFCLFGSQIACLLRSNYTWVGHKKI